jgi:hypothetical protein
MTDMLEVLVGSVTFVGVSIIGYKLGQWFALWTLRLGRRKS